MLARPVRMSGEVEGGEGVAGPVFSGRLLSAFFVAGALLAPTAAQAAPPVSVFNNNVPPVPCTVQADGITFCTDAPRSTVDSPVDGVPIDVNVGLPDESEFGSGPYPLMMLFHGYAGVKMDSDRCGPGSSAATPPSR